MLTDVPELCRKHLDRLIGLAESRDPTARLLIGGLVVEAEGCVACNPLGRGDDFAWIVRAHKSAGVAHVEEDCAVCLSRRWSLTLSKHSAVLPASTIEEYPAARAKLKATFPGYPREDVPDMSCRSTEEFLLKHGRRFAAQPLSDGEAALVRMAREELKREAGGVVPTGESRYGGHGIACSDDGRGGFICTPFREGDHIDPWDDFAVARFAWEVTEGRLSYAEGFWVLRGWVHPNPTAWSLIGDKVVHVRAGTAGLADTEYFGCVLDNELQDAPRGVGSAAYGRILPFGLDSLGP